MARENTININTLYVNHTKTRFFQPKKRLYTDMMVVNEIDFHGTVISKDIRYRSLLDGEYFSYAKNDNAFPTISCVSESDWADRFDVPESPADPNFVAPDFRGEDYPTGPVMEACHIVDDTITGVRVVQTQKAHKQTVNNISTMIFNAINNYLRQYPEVVCSTERETYKKIMKLKRFKSGEFTSLQASVFAEYYWGV